MGASRKAYNVWTDAIWGTEDDRKSVQGIAHMRYGGAVNWISSRQKSTALSSFHAEVMAGCAGGKEMAWMEKLRADIDPTESAYIPILFIDNQSGVEWSKDTKFHDKTKHIEIQYFFIRNDIVLRNRLKVQHVPGVDQIADILTKQLPFESFEKHRRSLGISEGI